MRWPRNTLYPQKLALTSPTSGGHSVLWTKGHRVFIYILQFKSNGFYFLIPNGMLFLKISFLPIEQVRDIKVYEFKAIYIIYINI
jgi:hypothetical protein